MVKKDDLIKNASICNIHLIKIDKHYKREYNFDFEIDEYVWVCGRNGHEGVLNDGGVLYSSRDLNELLIMIKNHRREGE